MPITALIILRYFIPFALTDQYIFISLHSAQPYNTALSLTRAVRQKNHPDASKQSQNKIAAARHST